MYTTVAFSLGVAGGAPFFQVTPAPGEDHVHVAGNFLYIPSFAPRLLGVYAGGIALARAQLRSPSIRQMFFHEITLLSLLQEPGSPQELNDYFDSGFPLTPGEPMECDVVNAGVTINSVIVFLGDGPAVPDNRPHLTIMAAGGNAAVANTWTNSVLAFQDTLPAGEYDIVGFQAQSTTCVAARLFVPGSFLRPGSLGTDVITDVQAPRFRHGRVGVMGHFVADTPPVAQILCTAADAAAVQFFFLDLVKTA